MAINYLSDKMYLSNAATNDVSFGSDTAAAVAWSEKPLALAGKTMVGGSETKFNEGCCDVWNWSTALNAWVFKHQLRNPDATPGGYFTFSIHMDKSVLEPKVLVVGATGSNRAYVFERASIAENFVLVAKLTGSDTETGDYYGCRVRVDEINGVIAVAAHSWDGPTWGNVGKIYLYEKDPSTGWPGDLVTPGTEDASVILPVGERTAANLYWGNGMDLRDGHLLATGRGGYSKISYFLRQSKSSWTHQQSFVPAGSTAGLCSLDMDSTATYAVAGIGDNGTRIVLIKRTGAGGSSWTEADELTKVNVPPNPPYENSYFGTIVKIAPDATSVAVASAGAYWNNGIGRGWLIPIVSDTIDESNEKIYEAADQENAHYFGSTLGWNKYHLVFGACGDDEEAENAGAIYQSLELDGYPSTAPEIISTAGGHKITLTGAFPEGTAVQAFMGPNGDETDEPCYSGEPGNAYAPVSLDGETLEIVSPPMSKGNRTITIRYGGDNYTDWGVTVVERHWPSVLFNARRNHPPWKGVGARRLELEDLDV